jgi:hypothetical protein
VTARKSLLQFQCISSVSNLQWHSDYALYVIRRRLAQMLTSSATDLNTIFGQESTTLKTLKKQTHKTERHLRSECSKTHFVWAKKALVYDRDYCLESYFLSFFLKIKRCFPFHLPSAKINQNMQHFRGKRTKRSNNTVKSGASTDTVISLYRPWVYTWLQNGTLQSLCLFVCGSSTQNWRTC